MLELRTCLIAKYSSKWNIVRLVEVNGDTLFDVPCASEVRRPPTGYHIALWLGGSRELHIPVDADDEFSPDKCSGGIAFIVAGRAEHTPASAYTTLASITGGLKQSEEDSVWIAGNPSADGKVRAGIEVGQDSVTISTSGASIRLTPHGINMGGRSGNMDFQQRKESALMAPNPLRFFPSVFFIPLPAELPELSQLISIGKVIQSLSRLTGGG